MRSAKPGNHLKGGFICNIPRYAYSCRFCPLEYFIVLRLKNNKKSQRANATAIHAYVANESTLNYTKVNSSPDSSKNSQFDCAQFLCTCDSDKMHSARLGKISKWYSGKEFKQVMALTDRKEESLLQQKKRTPGSRKKLSTTKYESEIVKMAKALDKRNNNFLKNDRKLNFKRQCFSEIARSWSAKEKKAYYILALLALLTSITNTLRPEAAGHQFRICARPWIWIQVSFHAQGNIVMPRRYVTGSINRVSGNPHLQECLEMLKYRKTWIFTP